MTYSCRMNHVINLRPINHFNVIAILMLSLALPAEGNEDDLYFSAVNHPERLNSDFAYDENRKPLIILPFIQISEGDQVLELGAGGGYTTELLSWLIGKSGRVYAHFLYQKERLADNRLSNVIPLRDHPLNEHAQVLSENHIESNQFDAIVLFFVLHDIYLNNEMNEELLATLRNVLKPGGNLIILDNAAEPDSGLAHIGDLHRIGEHFVVSEMEKAGFVYHGQSDALRNPLDDHTKPRGVYGCLQDRFAYRFKK